MALKTHLAAAVALSIPLSVWAQAEAKPAEQVPAEPKPVATIYGTLNVNVQTTRAAGAAVPTADVKSRYAVSTDSSNVGIRGGLDVSQWIKAVFQCETSANVDGIGPSGICNRNSRLGLSGPWGTLFYGNWDAPLKAAAYGTKVDDPFLNTDVFGYQGIMGSPGFNYRSGGWATASATSIAGFDVRASNSVAYWSPSWRGVGAKVQYAVSEFKNASGTQSPELYGASVNFDHGPLSVLAAYERHEDGFALVGINTAAGGAFGSTAANGAGSATQAVSSSDTAWRVGAGYQVDSAAGATTLGGLFEQVTLEQGGAPTGAVKQFKRNAWQMALKHRFGAHEVRARYSRAEAGDVTLNGATGSTKGYGAQMLAVGYACYLTKALQAYLSYAQIKNGENAQYTFTIGGSPAVAGSTPRGADPQALGLGLRYAF